MRKKKVISTENKKEIFWNVVNAGLAGALVLLGSFTTAQEITLRGLFSAIATAGIVALTKFGNYWATEKREYDKTKNLFKFL